MNKVWLLALMVTVLTIVNCENVQTFNTILWKRTEFRNEFHGFQTAMNVGQMEKEAARLKAKLEKEGTEMEVRQPSLNLNKSQRKGYIPPEHLPNRSQPRMKQAKDKGKAVEEAPVKKNEKMKNPTVTPPFVESGSSAPTIMKMSRTNPPKEHHHSHSTS